MESRTHLHVKRQTGVEIPLGKSVRVSVLPLKEDSDAGYDRQTRITLSSIEGQ